MQVQFNYSMQIKLFITEFAQFFPILLYLSSRSFISYSSHH